MNRDTVIALAQKAHGPITDRWWDMDVAALERFAALVAAHEREECAKAIDDSANISALDPIQIVLREQARCIRSRT